MASTSPATALSSDTWVDELAANLPGPSNPPRPALSTDELLAEMNRVPLFMTTLDETDGAGGDNELLDAIKALAYEGSRAEVAANFREQGNEMARARRWGDAREFYTKGVQTARGLVETVAPPDEEESKVLAVLDVDEDAERRKERDIEEACLANRALCNLEMKNYGACNRDCAAALRLNPRNIKAWFRAASACLALDRHPEADDACTSGLAIDPANTSLQALHHSIARRGETLAATNRARELRNEQARNRAATLRLALRARHIPSRETASPPDLEDAAITLADPDDAASLLRFPVLLLYPLHAQTDFIKAFDEDATLHDWLGEVLPLVWDADAQYGAAPASVECYLETSQGGLIKAGKKLSLVKILGSGKVEVVDGLVRVFVVPTSRAAEWIQGWKERNGKR